MSIELCLVFVVASALLVATPGPNVALIVGTSLTHGARTGLTAVTAFNVGLVIQLAVVAAGLSWIVDLFALHFDAIRFIGAAYLLFLGIQTLWKARSPSVPAPLSPERAFARGFAVAFADPEDADLPGGVPAAVPRERAGRYRAALGPCRDVRHHRGGRRCAVGARRRAGPRGAVGPGATDRRSGIGRDPDRGRRRAAGRKPALIRARGEGP